MKLFFEDFELNMEHIVKEQMPWVKIISEIEIDLGHYFPYHYFFPRKQDTIREQSN